MALKFRIKGRRPLGDLRQAVDVEWYDDAGAVLRRDLVAEAEALEARAAQLRTDAKVVPDQFTGDADDAGNFPTDRQVRAEIEKKRDLLVRHLGIAPHA